jgi:hypothetical protein
MKRINTSQINIFYNVLTINVIIIFLMLIITLLELFLNIFPLEWITTEKNVKLSNLEINETTYYRNYNNLTKFIDVINVVNETDISIFKSYYQRENCEIIIETNTIADIKESILFYQYKTSSGFSLDNLTNCTTNLDSINNYYYINLCMSIGLMIIIFNLIFVAIINIMYKNGCIEFEEDDDYLE